MSGEDPQPKAARRGRRRFQFGVRTLLVITALIAAVCAAFTWQAARAERQRQCVAAIRHRGGYVYYDYQIDGEVVHWGTPSPVPDWLRERLGEDFFHRVGRVELPLVLPADWEPDHELAAFDRGCLVAGNALPGSWERHGSHGERKLIWPAEGQFTADDWARAALRQYRFGCSAVTIYRDYCREALKLDPENITANLLLGETLEEEDGARAYLETVLRCASPETLEYAHAEKRLSGEKWTFEELVARVGADGVLH